MPRSFKAYGSWLPIPAAGGRNPVGGGLVLCPRADARPFRLTLQLHRLSLERFVEPLPSVRAKEKPVQERQDPSAPTASNRSDRRAPWRIDLRGWWAVAKRVKDEIDRDNVGLISAGTAFFAFFSIFPALAALFAIYGLITSPADVEQQLASFTSLLPADAARLIEEQMRRLASDADSSLGWGALVGFGISLWSANKGMKGIVDALNVAYDSPERRGFVRLNLVTLGLTLGGVLAVGLILTLVAGVPVLLGRFGLGDVWHQSIAWGRWPVLAATLVMLIGIVYHVAPNRPSPRWRWVTPGSLLATFLFLVASAGFSFYVSRFGTYNETYGSVAAVAVLMLWLYMGAYVVMLGGEINAETEREAKVAPPAEAAPEVAADAHPGSAPRRPSTARPTEAAPKESLA